MAERHHQVRPDGVEGLKCSIWLGGDSKEQARQWMQQQSMIVGLFHARRLLAGTARVAHVLAQSSLERWSHDSASTAPLCNCGAPVVHLELEREHRIALKPLSHRHSLPLRQPFAPTVHAGPTVLQQ